MTDWELKEFEKLFNGTKEEPARERSDRLSGDNWHRFHGAGRKLLAEVRRLWGLIEEHDTLHNENDIYCYTINPQGEESD